MITCAKYLKYKNCDYYKLQIYLSNNSIEIDCSTKMAVRNVYTMKPLISWKPKSKCQVFILCLMGEIKRMLTSIIFTVTSDQVKINRSISNSIKGRRIYRSVRFPINQNNDIKMAKQFNTVPYVKEWDQGNLGTAYKNTLYNNVCKIYQRLVGMFFFEMFRILETSLTLQFSTAWKHNLSEKS